MIQNKFIVRGQEVTATWISGNNLEKFKPYTQVYGVCFTKKGKVLIIQSKNNNWMIPGGTPEKNETPAETLAREIDEEASVEIEASQIIGAQKIYFPNNTNKKEGERFYQIRSVAIIRKIKPLTADPCTGKIWKRKFINPEEFNNLVQWGDVGKEIFQLAFKHFRKWQETGTL